MQKVVISLIISLLLAQKASSAPTENDAMALALADLKSIDIDEQYYMRYIWVKEPEANIDELREHMQCTVLVLNYISRATVLARPIPLGKDKLMLLRIDLRHYVPLIYF